MFLKIVAVVALVALPLNLSLWHRSHNEPVHYRWDLTLYKSVDVYLKEGVCGLHVLSMPTRTASRTGFEGQVKYDIRPTGSSFHLSSSKKGEYRRTLVFFPFWLPAVLLAVGGITPILQGPVRRWWRSARGLCIYCAYDLRGTRHRCPECGWRYA